jgi:tetratricopeptide (TPR) repeat protein
MSDERSQDDDSIARGAEPAVGTEASTIPAPEPMSEGERALQAIRRRAQEAAAAGELAPATVAYRELLHSRPKDVEARVELAAVLERRGDFTAAILELDAAANLAPEDPQVLLARGSLYSARGRYDVAEADLRRALRADGGNPEIYTQLGLLLSRAARWRESIEPLSRAVELDRERAQAHYLLGEAFNHVDDLPLALAAYETAARLQPSHWRALKGIGIVLDRMGRPAEAAAAYQRSREAQRR